jgi:hypothetical protein
MVLTVNCETMNTALVHVFILLGEIKYYELSVAKKNSCNVG